MHIHPAAGSVSIILRDTLLLLRLPFALFLLMDLLALLWALWLGWQTLLGIALFIAASRAYSAPLPWISFWTVALGQI